MKTIDKNLARCGAAQDTPPDRAHPAALRRSASGHPGGAPASRRAVFRRCQALSRPLDHHAGHTPFNEEGIMSSTTTTVGPADLQLRRGGPVTSPALGKDKSERPRMVRLTVNLPSDLVEQMRDAVYWMPGLTLAWLIARAVRASLADLETIHQGPFPRRLKPLRAGRPRLVGQSMNVNPSGGSGSTDGMGKSVFRTAPPVATRN